MIIKMARRNIFRHGLKSILIGIIVLIGSVLLTMGNSTISGMEKGFKSSIRDRFMGDITIMSKGNEAGTIFQMMGESSPVLTDFVKIESYLSNSEAVEDFMPYNMGYILLLTDSESMIGFPPGLFTMAVDFEKHSDYLNNYHLLYGEVPGPEESGILLSSYQRDFFYQYNGELYHPEGMDVTSEHLPEELSNDNLTEVRSKSDMILMGVSENNSTMDMRVPLKGVYEYKTLRNLWQEVNLIDVESYRQLMNYVTADASEMDFSEEESALMSVGMDDIERLFDAELSTSGSSAQELMDESQLSLDENEVEENYNSAAWELISIKLKPGENRNAYMQALNDFFESESIDAQALSWERASGTLGQFATLFRISLSFVVSLIFIVAGIIIALTLANSAMERKQEFGMMHAIGLSKKNMEDMIFTESAVLSYGFGIIGMLFGAVVVTILRSLQLESSNEFVQLIMGGNVYQPSMTFADVIVSFVFLTIMVLVSTAYPMAMVFNTRALDALQKD